VKVFKELYEYRKEVEQNRNHLEEMLETKSKDLEKTYEQLLYSEKLSALGKLTGSISHEFNNPLYGVSSVLEQLYADVVMEEKYKKLITLAIKECERMADLVKKLRDFYKPSIISTSYIEVNRLIEDILLLINKKLMSQHILILKQYDPDLPKINTVVDKIKQVFLNIIQNAEDAIPESGGNITIITGAVNNHVEIKVKDSGEGITLENIKNVFNPFFTTKGGKGTGLGLSVCYGIVKECGGDITVESKPGDGTCFTVKLPIERS